MAVSNENIVVLMRILGSPMRILGSPMKLQVGSPMKWGLRWVSADDDFFQDSNLRAILNYQLLISETFCYLYYILLSDDTLLLYDEKGNFRQKSHILRP